MKITDKYLTLWAEQHKREAKRRSLSAEEEAFGALVTEVQALRCERDELRAALDRMSPVFYAALVYVDATRRMADGENLASNGASELFDIVDTALASKENGNG